MNAQDFPATAWIFTSCFGLSIVSAVLPWFNGEVIVLALAAMLRSRFDLAVLAIVAAAGQMVGKCGLYWAGFQAGKLDVARNGRLERWRVRLRSQHVRAFALVFLSSTIGIPPLYLTTIAAGTVGMAFPRFLGAAACGRLVRFGTLVFCPRLIMGLLGRGSPH
jgi:membrane protein YqaA with SNARE-associated domain